MPEHLYIVAYDISDPKRWRKVFKVMNGYGAWVQLSVFQCRMSRQRRAELPFDDGHGGLLGEGWHIVLQARQFTGDILG